MKRVVVLNMYIYSFLLYNSVYTHFYLILRKVTIMSNLFDLNIKKVLENWSIADALREIIANALDETVLAKSPEIKIYKDSDKVWHIRDYGRGLQYFHLTQNENKEKLECNELIGKFGVGLKDALAVLYRKDCKVVIDSKYHHMTIAMEQKAGFNIKTLHVKLDDPIDKSMKGTDFIIYDLSDTDITNAKSMFLIFNKPTLLEKTRYGEVYNCNVAMGGTVYINGVKVASEPNFMFDYNITNVNKQIRKALNRERSNVGRSAYADTVKNILKSCKSDDVLLPLVNDLQFDIVDRTWTDDDGKVIYNDTIKEFVVEDVAINFDSTFIGKAVLKDGSIKHDVNIKFDDYIENVYPFTLELTQRSLVARYIKNNGYNVDFDKLSYDLGIRPKLIESTVSRFNHFYRDEEQQPVNLTYFDKGGKYLGDTQSEIDSLPSVSDIKSVDNGIDR